MAKICWFYLTAYNYLLENSNVGVKDLDNRFNKIDEKMSKIKIGSKVYEYGCWDEYYELTVVNIVDKENGIIAVIEPGRYGYENEIKNKCVYYLLFREDFA